MQNTNSNMISIDEVSPASLSSNTLVVFGGTFDPIHVGHLGVLRALRDVFPEVVIAPTSLNPWKDLIPTPLDKRIAMIEIALRDATLDSAVSIYELGYEYAEEVVISLRAKRPTSSVWWAVGEDSASSVHKWRNWTTLQVPVVTLPVSPMIHASDIRANPSLALPCLQNYIETHQLYG